MAYPYSSYPAAVANWFNTRVVANPWPMEIHAAAFGIEGLIYGRRRDWDSGGETLRSNVGYLDHIERPGDLRDAANEAENAGHAVVLFVAEHELFPELPVAPHEVLVFGDADGQAKTVLYDPKRRLVGTRTSFDDLIRAFVQAGSYRELSARSARLHPTTTTALGQQAAMDAFSAFEEGRPYDIDQNARQHWWWGTWWAPTADHYTAEGFGADAFEVVADYFDAFASSPLLDLRHFAAFVDHVASCTGVLWPYVDRSTKLALEDVWLSIRSTQADIRYRAIRSAQQVSPGPLIRQFADLARRAARSVLEHGGEVRMV